MRLTANTRRQLAAYCHLNGHPVDAVLAQADPSAPLEPQVRAWLDSPEVQDRFLDLAVERVRTDYRPVLDKLA